MGVFRNFPYSNFHEMNMDEIIKIIKNMLEEWAQYHAEWDAWMEEINDDWSNYQEVMNEAWHNMQDFINNYFDNLDVQEEINNKISEMVETGEFSAIVAPYIPPRVTEWLTANITEPVGVVIDTSLTVAGACADAKATGDAINDLESVIQNYYNTYSIKNRFIAGGYIDLSSGVGTTAPITSPTTTSGFNWLVIACKKGDRLIVSATGGTNARAWGILDSEAEILSVANANTTVYNHELKAEQDGYFVINCLTSAVPSSVVDYIVGDYITINALEKSVYELTDLSDKFINNRIIDLSSGVGTTADLDNPSTLEGFSYLLIPCISGDKITISVTGGASGRAFGVLDSDKKILSVAPPNAVYTNYTIITETDGYFVINASVSLTKIVKYSTPAIESMKTNIINATNHAELVLPRRVYGVVGKEFNLYKGNAILFGDADTVALVKFHDTINDHYETRKRFFATPTATRNTTPQFSLFKTTIKTRDEFKNVNIRINDPSELNGLTRNIVIIGDSKVAGGRLPQVFKNLCTEAGMNVGKLFGSVYKSNFDLYCEGRDGWSSVDYMNSAKGATINPFYNNGFDFAYWMTQQNYSSMDYVFINLGTNDYANNAGIGSDSYISTFISNINTMITSIHNYDSNIKIVIGLVEGVCEKYLPVNSGEELSFLNTRARLLNKACIEEWDNTTTENNNVFVCPIYLSMDLDEDYPMTEQPMSEWDAFFNTDKTINVVTDLIHQNNVGYAKNATYMFATLAYIESL